MLNNAAFWYKTFPLLQLENFCASLMYQSELVFRDATHWHFCLSDSLKSRFDGHYQEEILVTVQKHFPHVKKIEYNYTDLELFYTIHAISNRFHAACLRHAASALVLTSTAQRLFAVIKCDIAVSNVEIFDEYPLPLDIDYINCDA